MNDDHLSPEPLSTYHEIQAQEPQEQATNSLGQQENSDVVGAFTKIELEKQKRELEQPQVKYELTPDGNGFHEIKRCDFERVSQKIKHREITLYSLDNKARDDFNASSKSLSQSRER